MDKQDRSERAEDMKEITRITSTDGEPYEFSEQVGFLLRKAYQRNMSIFQHYSTDSNLTSVQFAVLCALMTYGPQSQSRLGRLTAIDASTTKGVIDRLRDRGLITLSAEKADKRKTIVHLADAGRRLIDSTVDAGLRITEATLGPLNAAERVALVYLLKKIAEAPYE